MFTPAESLPVNDIEILIPIVNSSNVSEMLIVDEKSRQHLAKTSGSQNPFHLTTYPRVCSLFDLHDAKGKEVFDAVVDIACVYGGIDSNQKEVMVPIRGSGFLVAPPNKLQECWEYYFFTCLHYTLPFTHEKNGEDILVTVRSIHGILGKAHRYEPLSVRSVLCTVVAKSELGELEDEKKHANKDWVLMKMEVPLEVVEDEGQFPSSYFIPSPSKMNPCENDCEYNMCILSFPGVPKESDVALLEKCANYHTNVNTLRSQFELDCKCASFGKFVPAKDEFSKHYNASSFPGSSGGAILPCQEKFSLWREFKRNVSLNRFVIGIHVGSEKNFNRCCLVAYWFDAFLKNVFLPMKYNFTNEEIEFIENESKLKLFKQF